MAAKFGYNKFAKMGKKTKKEDRLAEITFDRDARKEYLTGFHKRKLARIKAAQDAAIQREKEEKLKDRQQVRLFRATIYLLYTGWWWWTPC